MNLNLPPMSMDEIKERTAEHLKKLKEQIPETALAQYREVPARYKMVFAKAYVEKGLSAKVKAKCLDCTCFQQSEIKNCTCEGCPLWSVRPYK